MPYDPDYLGQRRRVAREHRIIARRLGAAFFLVAAYAAWLAASEPARWWLWDVLHLPH